MGDSKFNSRASARLFGNAINMLRNQSSTSEVRTSSRKQQECLPIKIGNTVPSPRMTDDYSLPPVADFTEDANTSKSLLNPSFGLQERHWLPVTSILATMSDHSLERADEDYMLPVFGSNTYASRLHTHESDLASNISCDYDLPLTTASYKGLSSSGSDNSGGPASDVGYETEESLEKEFPESLRDKDEENTGYLDCEPEDKFPCSFINKEASRQPKYNPKLSMKLNDVELPVSSGDRAQKNTRCLDFETEDKFDYSLSNKKASRRPRYIPQLSMKFIDEKLPKSSGNKAQKNTRCLDFEAEAKFPYLLRNKQASHRPRYNPKLSMKFIDEKLPKSSGNKAQKNTGCLDCEAEDKFHRSRSTKEDFCLPRYDPKLILRMKFRQGFVDCHCHIDFLFNRENFKGTFSEYRRQHKESFPDSYEGCVAVFCNPDTFNKKYVWQKILSEDNVWAAFGCHPKKSMLYSDRREHSLIEALDHHRVKALGEIGLDYSDRNKSDKETQHDVFRRQLNIAKCRKLPLVIHCREANEDTLKIMKEILPRDYKIHLHCFSDVWEYAQIWLDTFPNLCIGITNLVTFSSAKEVHQVVKKIPLNRLLLETDAPYFVPQLISRKNSKWSHPGMALHVAAQIAALRGDSLENIVHQTRKNAYQIYGI